jgi:hypothetical protein
MKEPLLSPLAANIYFHQLDLWVERELIPNNTYQGNSKKISRQYLDYPLPLHHGLLENVGVAWNQKQIYDKKTGCTKSHGYTLL